MLRIHERLAAGRYPNCAGLAVELEVSAKTVQRDIDFMRDQLLLPVGYDAVRHGFYYTKPVSQFPLVNVSQGELVALLIAQKAVEQYRGTAFEGPLRSALEKLASSLDQETSVSLHALSEAVSFRAVGVAESELAAYDLLAGAVLERRMVSFDYLGIKDARPERRTVEPLHLTCIDAQWYLIGHDVKRGARRTFALPRIRRVRLLERHFEDRERFSVGEMLAGSFAVFEAGEPVGVEIRFDALAGRLVGERRWHEGQRLEKLGDGGVVLRMKVGLAPDLEKWILGWGSHAEVVHPRELREKIAREAAAMADIYAEG
ncbi:MAG: WYL domain-containing protein [Terrimicrobiaceae bacterium]